MKKRIDWVEVALGVSLVGLAILPTPDDVTVISPTAQAGAGIALIAHGLGYVR